MILFTHSSLIYSNLRPLASNVISCCFPTGILSITDRTSFFPFSWFIQIHFMFNYRHYRQIDAQK
jgi:hypothetical protein